jgi:hypothetical protein
MQGVATATAVLVTVRIHYVDGGYYDRPFADAGAARVFAVLVTAFAWVERAEVLE